MSYDYSPATRARLEAYYRAYYCTALGLLNGVELAKLRLHEEETETGRIKVWEQYVGSAKGKRILNIGCGTGGFNLALASRGIPSIGIDPDQEAIEIAQLKARDVGEPPGMFLSGHAENLPFPDLSFDLIYCYTVLEHVDDVSKSLQDMVRVLRPGGQAYIDCPHGLNLYEGHYKVFWLPIFRIPAIGKLYLRLIKRPPEFLYSLNFITYSHIRRSLKGCSVNLTIIKKRPNAHGIFNTVAWLYYKALGVSPQIEMVITKN